MRKEKVRTVILMSLCAVGGLLVGFNARHLSNGINAALFAIGIALASVSITLSGLFQTVWRRKSDKSEARNIDGQR